jgi:hypothetical protein
MQRDKKKKMAPHKVAKCDGCLFWVKFDDRKKNKMGKGKQLRQKKERRQEEK